MNLGEYDVLWRLIYLAFDCGMVVACTILWERTPDMIQRIVLVLFGLSGIIFGATDILALIHGDLPVWKIKVIGRQVEHIGVLVYLLRQIWIRSGICLSVKSSQQPDK